METKHKTITLFKNFKGNLLASHIRTSPFLSVPLHRCEAYYLGREYKTGTSLRGTDI